MSTLFKQAADNAGSTTSTSMAATGVTSIVVETGDGTKFPTPGNGFRVTLWNAVTYAEPGLDPQMEIVNVTARTTDTLTISATTKTHTSPCRVDLLTTAAALNDIHLAVNNVENIFSTTGAWTAYTPTWTSTGTAPALGNGTLVGAYAQIGKTVIFRFAFTAGSTSTYGSGSYIFSYPVAPHSAIGGNYGFLLAGYAEDSGVAGYSINFGRGASATGFYLASTSNGVGGANTYQTTVPFTWGSGDFFSVHGMYEAA